MHSRAAIAASVSVILTCTGCPPRAPDVRFAPAREAAEALGRVNDNLRALEQAIECPGLISVRFRDEDGSERRLIGNGATLIFQRPRCLYLDIKSPAGSLARVGSNDERFWIWFDAGEQKKLWWGEWRSAGMSETRFPVPPAQLLDALLLNPLPEKLADGARPLLQIIDNERRLLFPRLDARGWPHVSREIVLDSAEPRLPRRLIDRDAEGALLMDAELSGYARVEGDGPWTARRYVVRWPAQNAELRLDLLSAKPRTKKLPFCEFPEEWTGEIEQVCDDAGGEALAATRREPR